MNCDHCGLPLESGEQKAFRYLDRVHRIHVACAKAYVKVISPDVTPQNRAQLIRESLLEYVYGTNTRISQYAAE